MHRLIQGLILATAMLAMAGISPGLARDGHGHFGHSARALSAHANPSVPPSLTPLPSHRELAKADTSAPVKLDPEDAKLNQMIKNICRGC
jgi:hypothetical protein